MIDLGFTVERPTQIYVDNEAARKLSMTHVHGGRLKHVEVSLAFVNERVERGDVEAVRIGTKENVADLLTKMTPPATFKSLVSRLVRTIIF